MSGSGDAAGDVDHQIRISSHLADGRVTWYWQCSCGRWSIHYWSRKTARQMALVHSMPTRRRAAEIADELRRATEPEPPT